MRINLRLLAAMVLGPAAVHGDGTPSRLAEAHFEAAGLLRTERWAEAIGSYRALLERGPDDSLLLSAQLGLAQALSGGGKHGEAVKALEKLREMIDRQVDGQEAVTPWRHAVQRELGRVYQTQGKLAEAIMAYGRAINAMGTEPSLADERARVRLAVADCLSRGEKRAEAIELLTETLDELSAPEFAGMRALQKASLARHYMEMGERDWAVTLLEEIRRDPQLDPQHFAAAEAMARGESWKAKATGKMRTREGPGYLAIEAEGRFELRVATPPAGGKAERPYPVGEISVWYNLEDDPFRTTNLMGARFLPLLDPPPAGVESEEQGMVSFKVIEDSPLRIRTRTSHALWPQEVIEHTFYPSGHVFVAVSCMSNQERPPVRLGGVACLLRPGGRVNWRMVIEEGARMTREGALQGESRYLLAHSNTIPSIRRAVSDDLLVCFSNRQRPQVRVMEGARLDGHGQSAVMRLNRDGNSEQMALAGQILVYPRTIDSAAAALPYVDDYQSPATIVVSRGRVVRDDPGDLNGDGYNESEGCHVVGATGSVVIDPGEFMRHAPVVKFLEVEIQGIPDLEVNGTIAVRESYNLVRLGRMSFLLQWLGAVQAGARMEFTLK